MLCDKVIDTNKVWGMMRNSCLIIRPKLQIK